MTTSTRRSAGRAAAVGAVLALAMTGLAATAQAAPPSGEGRYGEQYVIDQGHLDLFYIAAGEGGALHTVSHTDQHGNLTPEDLVLHVEPSIASRTAGTAVAGILGVAPGSTYYLMPQNNLPGQLFVGFGYDTSIVAAGTNVTHTISDVEGPGTLVAWQSGEEGPEVWLGTIAGQPDSFTSPANHEHLNWGLTALGEYTFDVTSTVHLPGGDETLAPQHYTVYVGEELPAADPDPDPEPGPEPAVAVSITGLSAHYHAGGAAVLTAAVTPASDATDFRWSTKAAGEVDWSPVESVSGPRYGFVVGTPDNGRQVAVELYDADGVLVGASEPVTVVVDDHGNDPVNGPVITASLSATEGALTISVAPENRDVQLTPFVLNAAADRLVAAGELKPIRVTDTRAGNPGWSASARLRTFVSTSGDTLAGTHLGWAPAVLSAAAGQTVTPGAAVAGTLSGGPGLSAWTPFASGAAGAGRGNADLGASLTLEAPTTLVPGTYSGLLILTVI